MKALIGVLIFLVVAVGAAFAVSSSLRAEVSNYLSQTPTQERPSEETATTTPEVNEVFTQGTVRIRFGENKTIGGVTLAPLSLSEDSRCPQSVQCIWAGTVRVRVQLVGASGTSSELFTLGEEVTTESRAITLIEVLPARITTGAPASSEYEFIFEVKSR